MAAVVNVSDYLDRVPLGRFHARTMALCVAAMVTDGFDVQAISYVAPALKLAEPVTREALGPVFSASLLGLMLGALLVGYAADVVGRRTSLIFCLLGFGLLSLLTARAETLNELLLLRLVTGLLLGGVMPNAVSLASEYAPSHRRALATTVTICGFSGGAAIGGLLAGLLLEEFSWRSVFYVGGAAPLVVAVLASVWLPESARFLVARAASSERIRALLRQVDRSGDFGPGTKFVLAEERDSGFPVAQLFQHGRTVSTLLVWVAFFMNNVVLYAVTNWLPVVLRDGGLPVSQAVVVTAMFQVGGTLGLLAIGRLSDRFAGHRVVGICFLCAAVAIASIGTVPFTALLLGSLVFCAGLCVVGGQGGTVAITGGLYPTAIRSTGIGCGLGAARLGGVFGPLAGSAILSQHWMSTELFLAAAAPALIAALAVSLVGLGSSGRGPAQAPPSITAPFVGEPL